MLEASNRLRDSAEFELCELIAKQPEMLDRVVATQIAEIEREIAELTKETERLGAEIEELRAWRQKSSVKFASGLRLLRTEF